MSRQKTEDERGGAHRRWALQMQQPLPPTTIGDRVFFLIGTGAAIWLAVVIAMQGVRSWWALLLLVPVWAILAYLALPRLHRMLSDLYVPDYFFGRTRTSDGLLGDPVNLGVDGSAAQLDAVMTAAGWHRADEITAASTWGIIVSTLTRRSYPTAPVSPLMLFGRRHDVAYQQEVEGNPKQRHHVRFWHCPPGWLLPGGAKADWLGAGTYDTDVGLSFFTLQVTHRIDENTDIERDYVVASARAADPAVQVRVLNDFTTGYHARNGGGDRFITDGNLPVIDVSAVTVPDEPQISDASEARSHPDSARAHAFARDAAASAEQIAQRVPLSIVAGIAFVLLSGVIELVAALADEDIGGLLISASENERITAVMVLVLSGLITLAQVVTCVFVLRGGRRSRALLLVLLSIGILVTAFDYLDGQAVLALNMTLLTASLDCIALLALSSESASAWSHRKQRRTRKAPSVAA